MRSLAVVGEPVASLGARRSRRLREVWRSAGWPCRDMLQLDLLAAGLLVREFDADEVPPAYGVMPADGQAMLSAPPADAGMSLHRL